MSEEHSRSQRLPSTDELLSIVRWVVDGAREGGVRLAVAGGLAMQLRGSPRLTKDIGFVADAPPPRSLELTFERPLSFGGQSFRTPDGIPVDWILREDDYRELYRDALDRAEILEGWIPVVRAPYLAAMKLATLRARDYEDLMFLLAGLAAAAVEESRRIVFERLGGKFAADQFDAAVDEARWRAETERE